MPLTTAHMPMVQPLIEHATYVYRVPGCPREFLVTGSVASCFLQDDGKMEGFLAARPDGRFTAGLEICALANGEISVRNGLAVVERLLAAYATRWFMVLGAPAWLQQKLPTGFIAFDTVVFYERRLYTLPAIPMLPAGITCELLRGYDNAIAAIDEAGFAPFWQAGESQLRDWLSQAHYTYLLRASDVPVAYIIGSQQQQSGHIARLAVIPAFQGRGLATWLLLKVLQAMQKDRIQRATLNTQASNLHARRLYERLGFQLTDDAITVLVKPLSSRGA